MHVFLDVSTSKQQSNNAIRSMAAMSAEMFGGIAGRQHRKSLSILNNSLTTIESNSSVIQKTQIDVSKHDASTNNVTFTGDTLFSNDESTSVCAVVDGAVGECSNSNLKRYIFETYNGKTVNFANNDIQTSYCYKRTMCSSEELSEIPEKMLLLNEEKQHLKSVDKEDITPELCHRPPTKCKYGEETTSLESDIENPWELRVSKFYIF